MFTLSNSAKKELEAFFSQNERSYIRIFPGQGGWMQWLKTFSSS